MSLKLPDWMTSRVRLATGDEDVSPLLGVALTGSDENGMVEVKMMGGPAGETDTIDNTDSPEGN